jgi:glycosyltransferase involved in cell wall biosynthesis
MITLCQGDNAQNMRNDVAIYAPFAAGVYERTHRRTGGAERQTALLARALSDEGLRVAHIIHRVKDPLAPPNSNLSLVERRMYAGHRRFGTPLETSLVWKSLRDADAGVYIFRTGSPMLGIVAAFCRLRRRRLIFASSTDSDFSLEALSDAPAHRLRTMLYLAGLRHTDAVVAQTSTQAGVAQKAFPHLRTAHIPSFAAPLEAAQRPGQSFLWIGRVVDYKRPLSYIELARALPEARFRMVIATSPLDPHGFAAEVRRVAATAPNLELLEARPHDEVMKLVGQAVAVVSTSHMEGMPNVFLEGWARGVPALTLEFDPDQIIGDRGLGLAAEGSWDRFVDGARQLWEARDDDSQMAHTSRAYIEEVHGIPVVTRRWMQLLSEIAKLYATRKSRPL